MTLQQVKDFIQNAAAKFELHEIITASEKAIEKLESGDYELFAAHRDAEQDEAFEELIEDLNECRSDREKALEWWEELPIYDQINCMNNAGINHFRPPSSLTESEIRSIWEAQQSEDSYDEYLSNKNR